MSVLLQVEIMILSCFGEHSESSLILGILGGPGSVYTLYSSCANKII